MEKQGIIYKATNIITDQCYIGKSTISMESRIDDHYKMVKRNKRNIYFHNALRKYGLENFTWEEQWRGDVLLINIMETFKIMANHSHESEGGYNCTWGGDGIQKGYKATDVSRQNCRIGQIRRYRSPKARKVTSKAQLKSYAKNPERAKNHSIAMKRLYTETPELRILHITKRQEGWDKKRNSPAYPGWICTDPDGQQYITKNLTRFCKERGLSTQNMHKVSKGTYKHHKHWVCVREVK